jgi:tryptophan synthase alpha chain
VPFSDPMADGPVIQHASERAIAKGVGLHDVLAWVANSASAMPTRRSC